MQKLGYVSSCLGLIDTAKLLGLTYQQLVHNYYSHEIFTSTHQSRLDLIASIIKRSGYTPSTLGLNAWLSTPLAMLGGHTPMEFISQWKPGRADNSARVLILSAPAIKNNTNLTLAA